MSDATPCRTLARSEKAGALVPIPAGELALVVTLPLRAQDDLRVWRARFAPVCEAVRRQGHEVTPREIARLLRVLARRHGCHELQVRRRWDAFRDHGWRGLVDKRLAGPAWYANRGEDAISLHPDFINFWKTEAEKNQRGSRQAQKLIIRRWKQWRAGDASKAIPGYATPPEPTLATGEPAGWSYANLWRHLPSRFLLRANRIGRAAAAAERPKVYQTRKGLWVMGQVMVDDVFHDLFVNTFVERQAGRPMELFSFDVFSGCKVRWGVRVRTKDEEGNYRGLARWMLRMVIVATFYEVGYSPRGTELVTEGGTAAVEGAFAEALERLSDGLITVNQAGMTGAAAHGGQYPGLARGNPRHKAHLESRNSLDHNAMAHLPGQTGKDVPNRPEQLAGLLKANAVLLAALDRLPPARAELLDFPLLELGQFLALQADIYREIESDPDHELEGWVECGHVMQQGWFEDQGGWVDLAPERLALLTPEARAQMDAMLASGKLPTRPRRLTRREVFDLGAGELIRLPGHAVWELLREDLQAPRKVTGNEVAFDDQEISSERLRFATIGRDAAGQPVQLRDRETYACVVNPFAPDTLFAADAAGRYLGEFRAIPRVCRADAEALKPALGAAAKREGELLADTRQRHGPAAVAKAARDAHNAAIISTAPALPRATRRSPTPVGVQVVPPSTPAPRIDRVLALLADVPDADLDGTPVFTPHAWPALPAGAGQPPQTTEEAQGDDLSLLL